MRPAPSPSPIIRFDRRKYGPELLLDACTIADIPGFITGPTRPHRLGFYEIALVTSGAGTLELDGVDLPVAPGRALLTEPGETRRWRLPTETREPLAGLLVFFEAEFFNAFFGDARFVETLPLVAADAAQRSLAPTRRAFEELVDVAGLMRDELRTVRDDTSHALRADGYRLLVALQRLGHGRTAARPDASRALARRFADLVEQRFALADGVTDYAERLHVTPRHLNDCVQRACGRTASETIHARRMLEARRLLLHTGLSVGAIAEALNFSDASYFVRFFRCRAGATPLEFRRRGA
jgi:AraC family transcriptional regulator, transcriptional activator of pobA